jgi:hypothetical protein
VTVVRRVAAAAVLTVLGAIATDAAAQVPTTLQVVAVAPGYPGRLAGDDRWLIYLDGPIDPGAPDRLDRLVAAEGISSAIVYLNSPGGSLVSAMQLGRALRAHGFDARVGMRAANPAGATAGTCHSACPFVLAGGVRRSLVAGSTIGLHRAENRVPVGDDVAFQRSVEAQVVDYLAEMGLPAAIASLMAGIPHDQIRDLNVDEAVQLKLVNANH